MSDRCAFCETPLVRDSDATSEPVDLVAPFALTAQQAGGRLKKALSGKYLAPESVRTRTRPEELTGVLVPFWCYDALARSEYTAKVGIYWYETQTYTVTVNGKSETRTRRVRHTEWHPLSGTHLHTYTDHLVSGSQGLPEEEANQLEPFDLGRALPFDPSLLAGQIAERPSVSHAEAQQTATQELAHKENAAIQQFLPGDVSSNVQNTTTTEVDAVRLVLLPVWIATYTHKDQVFRMLVNGQTGEVVGNVPRSGWKIAGAVGCVLFLIFGALFTILVLSAVAGNL
ncbi:MAG: hypothetical protein AAFV53_19045 [Myxococcota bacterium]